MTKLQWQRIPRRGFVPSHWVTKRPDGREISIWQSVTKHGRTGPRIVKAVLIPSHRIFDNVVDAKRAAEQLP